MKFEDWKAKNADRTYTEILGDILTFEDQDAFTQWCDGQGMKRYTTDWAMLTFFVFDQRLKALEKKGKDK